MAIVKFRLPEGAGAADVEIRLYGTSTAVHAEAGVAEGAAANGLADYTFSVTGLSGVYDVWITYQTTEWAEGVIQLSDDAGTYWVESSIAQTALTDGLRGSEIGTAGSQGLTPAKTHQLMVIDPVGGPGGTPIDYRDTIDSLVALTSTQADLDIAELAIAANNALISAIRQLPAYTVSDTGKFVSVTSGGSLAWVTLAISGFLGVFDDIDDLRTQHPTQPTGKYFAILQNPSAPPSWAIWDSDLSNWVEVPEPANFTANLSIGSRTSTTLEIACSVGTNATIPSASASLAGLISAADYAKLQNAVTGSAGLITSHQISASDVVIPTDDNILTPGGTITWSISDNGPVAVVSLTQNASLVIDHRPASGGTYLLRVITNGFGLAITAPQFERPDGGESITLTGTAILSFVDWGNAFPISVFPRNNVQTISS